MAKRPTVTSITSGYASNTQLNANFEALRDGFDNTLSLDGSVPNAMEVDFDLGGNDLLNGGTLNTSDITVGGISLSAQISVVAADAAQVAIDRAAVAADLLLTGADTVATAADRAAVAADLLLTDADTVATAADRAAVAADLLLTDADTVATAADRVQTGLDAAATAADVVLTNADVVTAAASAAAAAASYDSFDDRYLGSKASAPALDNDGNALLTGAIYWNSTSSALFIYTGSAWSGAVFDTAGALFGSNNLSDVDNAATALSNLGLSATATELNYVDGVTSAIQTQLNTKAASSNPVFTGSIEEQTGTMPAGITPAIDPANGTVQEWTLTGNSSPTDSLTDGEFVELLIQDGTAYTITWPTITWLTDSATAPTLGATTVTPVLIQKVGSTLYGRRTGDGG